MPGPALPGGDLAGGQNNGVPPLPGQTPDNGQNQNPACRVRRSTPTDNLGRGYPANNLRQLPGQQPFPVPPGTPMPGQQQGVPVMQGQQGVPADATGIAWNGEQPVGGHARYFLHAFG